ncbi:MAG: cytochrome c family protein [Gemmatimonadota bacterium]|nr:cytochrome c family protein [Gemmatimonadota bacterium]
MKRLFIAVLAGALVVFIAGAVAAEYKHQFTGASKCKICHMSKKKGSQFKVWQDSDHAKAYHTLLSQKAIEMAKGDKKPHEDPACLKCHVTGWDAPEEMLGKKYDKTEGITCETCHGPGKDFSPIKVMRDREKAVAAGLNFPKEADCKKCHNEESPNYIHFSWDEKWPKVAHPNPLKKKDKEKNKKEGK